MKHKCPDLHAERCTNSSAGLASGVSLKVFKLSFAPRSLLCVYIHLGFSRTREVTFAAALTSPSCSALPRSREQRLCHPQPRAAVLQTTSNSRHCFSTTNLSVAMPIFYIYIYFFNIYIYFSRFSVLRARQPVLETSL